LAVRGPAMASEWVGFVNIARCCHRHLWWNGGYFGTIFQVKSMLPKAEVCPFPHLHLGRQLSDLQTPQGQLLNNFISGTAGGFLGTVVNTPYVRPFYITYRC
jgi:hypothetical protein